MNQKMKTILTIFLIFIASIFLAIVLAPLGEVIDTKILGIYCGSGIFTLLFNIFNAGCYLQGFIYFYILFLSLFSFYFLERKTAWLCFIIGTIFFWIIAVLYTLIITESLKYIDKDSIGNLIVMLLFFMIGYIVAFVIRKIIRSQKLISMN